MAGLSDHLLSIPPVTRFFLIVTVAVSLGISLDIFSMDKVMFLPNTGFGMKDNLASMPSGALAKWQLVLRLRNFLPLSYKVFTSFFVVDGIKYNGVRVLLNVYRFYSSSNSLESSRGHFKGNFPDYLWFVMVSGAFLLAINQLFAYFGFLTLYYHCQLSLCITFLWLRTLMNSVINFMGVVRIKAYYLPLFDLGLSIISGGHIAADSFAGILAGYLYECIQSDTLPIYNLLPGAYGMRTDLQTNGQRVGFNVDTSILSNTIHQAVFDLGYWKAPAVFYRLLKYPINTSVRTTAFSQLQNIHAPTAAKPAAANVRYDTLNSFKGRGHRLGT